MTTKKNKIEVVDDNEALLSQKKDLEQCETDLYEANKTITEHVVTKKEQSKLLKIAQKEIEKSEKIQKIYEKGLRQMMYIISHKIRQPITKIMGLSVLLEDETNNPEEIQQIVSYIKQSSELLDEFTKELTLFVSKQEEIKDAYK
jgi:signal transduction histidine kinase